jgi:hypothetical protein
LSKVEFLQKANQATLSEVRNFIEFERLHGLGCGIVDLTPIVQAPIKDAIKSRNTKAKKTMTPTITSLRYF